LTVDATENSNQHQIMTMPGRCFGVVGRGAVIGRPMNGIVAIGMAAKIESVP
jgi:hypothetical protein